MAYAALNVEASFERALALPDRLEVEHGLSPGADKSLGLGLMTWVFPNRCTGLSFSRLCIRVAIMALVEPKNFWRSFRDRKLINSLFQLLSFRTFLLGFEKYGGLSKAFS